MMKNNYNSSNNTSENDLHILGKDDYIALFENKKDRRKKQFRLFGNH
jgi:hypothetical protein